MSNFNPISIQNTNLVKMKSTESMKIGVLGSHKRRTRLVNVVKSKSRLRETSTGMTINNYIQNRIKELQQSKDVRQPRPASKLDHYQNQSPKKKSKKVNKKKINKVTMLVNNLSLQGNNIKKMINTHHPNTDIK